MPNFAEQLRQRLIGGGDEVPMGLGLVIINENADIRRSEIARKKAIVYGARTSICARSLREARLQKFEISFRQGSVMGLGYDLDLLKTVAEVQSPRVHKARE